MVHVAPLPGVFQESAPVTYHEAMAFLVAPSSEQRDAAARARAASEALTAAIDANAPANMDAPLVQVSVEDGAALVRVRGYLIIPLYAPDARAAGFPNLETYAQHLEARLKEFVPAQMTRGALQRTVLHLFLSVFLGLLGFIALGQIRALFNRAEAALDQRRETLAPFTILRIPVLSGDAVGGVMAFSLVVGRILGYAATLVAAISAILGQFDATAPWLNRFFAWLSAVVLHSVQNTVSIVPGLLLAVVLMVAVYAGLRVMHMLLDGVTRQRLVWHGLPPARVPPVRMGLTLAVLTLGAPLIVAAAFGGFGSPLETLVLAGSSVLLLAALPVLASLAVGCMVVWRQMLQPGDWVQVGVLSGEITSLSLLEVNLVPEGGGTISVPMLHLVLHPVRRLNGPPQVCLALVLVRDRPVRESLNALRRAVTAVEASTTVHCVRLTGDQLHVCVNAPSIRADIAEAVWLALGDAAERGELTLAPFSADAGPRAPA